MQPFERAIPIWKFLESLPVLVSSARSPCLRAQLKMRVLGQVLKVLLAVPVAQTASSAECL